MLKSIISAYLLCLIAAVSQPAYAVGILAVAGQVTILQNTLARPNIIDIIDQEEINPQPAKMGSSATDKAVRADNPITQLGSAFHNGIDLLQNRFRIDYEVEEITMIFFREYGSVPIVLVRPDGSKVFFSDGEKEDSEVFWFDSSTYDMISIKNPTPGPWQAIGKISPDSRVMVISDLELHADPLPSTIFSGEILKQTAYLTNDGKAVDYKEIRDVVELTVSLSSTNNTNFSNFGANDTTIAIFEDNGKGMDERPLDGVFTGQYNLTVAGGEWIPTYNVSTPMYTREQVSPPIMVYGNPIKVDVEMDGAGVGYHKLIVDADREHVDISTLLVDGKIRFPNGDIQNFSITTMSAKAREHLILNYDYGVYRIKLTAYGNTIDGREFILDVPEYSFLSEQPEPEVVVPDPADTVQIAELPPIEPEVMVDEKMSTSTLVSLIVAINLFIIVVGGGGIWFVTRDTSPKNVAKKNIIGVIRGFFSRFFPAKEQAPAPVKPKKTVDSNESDYMDLSIPKD